MDSLHNDFILYCIRCRLVLISGGEVGNFNNRVASNFFPCTYDICSAYRKLISVMCSLLLASGIMFLQTIINLLLLKNYYKFHSFRVRNVLISFSYLIIWYDFDAWFRPFLILLSGDIERNPRPKPISGQSFSICHWNLNSISAHNYTKISLLTAYVLVHNFDIICLSETYLNSETSTDDQNLVIPGYCLLRADHPSVLPSFHRSVFLQDYAPFETFKYFIS